MLSSRSLFQKGKLSESPAKENKCICKHLYAVWSQFCFCNHKFVTLLHVIENSHGIPMNCIVTVGILVYFHVNLKEKSVVSAQRPQNEQNNGGGDRRPFHGNECAMPGSSRQWMCNARQCNREGSKRAGRWVGAHCTLLPQKRRRHTWLHQADPLSVARLRISFGAAILKGREAGAVQDKKSCGRFWNAIVILNGLEKAFVRMNTYIKHVLQRIVFQFFLRAVLLKRQLQIAVLSAPVT